MWQKDEEVKSQLTIIKNGDDKNHERREVKFPDDIQQHKT